MGHSRLKYKDAGTRKSPIFPWNKSNMMKKLGIALVATFAWIQTSLANDDAWLTDLTKAKALAKKENKIVLMDFTGSDWCPPCKALHRNVLTAKEFTDFAKEKLVLVLVDFPTGKPLP